VAISNEILNPVQAVTENYSYNQQELSQD